MRRRTSIELLGVMMALVASLLALTAPIRVWAEPQPGGVPSLDERVKTLEALVGTLSTALAAEAAARAAADSTLQSAITEPVNKNETVGS